MVIKLAGVCSRMIKAATFRKVLVQSFWILEGLKGAVLKVNCELKSVKTLTWLNRIPWKGWLFANFHWQAWQSTLAARHCNESFHYARFPSKLSQSIMKQVSLEQQIHAKITSSSDGAGTRRSRQRLLIGEMTRLADEQHRMKRIFEEYFSMVRRRACWASLVNLSASLITTTKIKINKT